MSNAHPSTGLQNSYKYHINYIYSTINNNIISLIQHFESDIESQLQNPEFTNNPEDFHPCIQRYYNNMNILLLLFFVYSPI